MLLQSVLGAQEEAGERVAEWGAGQGASEEENRGISLSAPLRLTAKSRLSFIRAGKSSLHKMAGRPFTTKEEFEQYFDEHKKTSKVDIKRADNAGLYVLHHVAKSGGYDMSLVKFIYRNFSQACSKRDYDGWLPFHHSLTCTTPNIELVRFLHAKYPKSAVKRDDNDAYPLHVAVGADHQDDEIISFVLNMYPVATSSVDRKGRLPIHCALQGMGASLSSVALLYQAYPDALERPDVTGMLPSHHAAHLPASRLDTVEYIAECSDDADVGDTYGLMPLHHAASSAHSNLAVVQLIYALNEGAVRSRDVEGRWPLHHAARCENPNLEVLRFLYEKAPEAVEAKCFNGMLPLHYVAGSAATLEVVSYVHSLHPEAAYTRDKAGRIPLQLAAGGPRPSVDLLKFLHSHHNSGGGGVDGARVVDQDGRCALHHAAGSADPAVEVLSFLHSLAPDVGAKPDLRGMTVLHHAMSAGLSRPDVLRLVHGFQPHAAVERDANGRLPVHLAAANPDLTPDSLGLLLWFYSMAKRKAGLKSRLMKMVDGGMENASNLLLPTARPLLRAWSGSRSSSSHQQQGDAAPPPQQQLLDGGASRSHDKEDGRRKPSLPPPLLVSISPPTSNRSEPGGAPLAAAAASSSSSSSAAFPSSPFSSSSSSSSSSASPSTTRPPQGRNEFEQNADDVWPAWAGWGTGEQEEGDKKLRCAMDGGRAKGWEALTVTDNHGRLPLHHATAFGRAQTVKALVRLYPEGVRVEDDMDALPLHYAFSNALLVEDRSHVLLHMLRVVSGHIKVGRSFFNSHSENLAPAVLLRLVDQDPTASLLMFSRIAHQQGSLFMALLSGEATTAARLLLAFERENLELRASRLNLGHTVKERGDVWEHEMTRELKKYPCPLVAVLTLSAAAGLLANKFTREVEQWEGLRQWAVDMAMKLLLQVSQPGAVKGVPAWHAGAAAMDGVSPNGMSCVDIAVQHDYLVDFISRPIVVNHVMMMWNQGFHLGDTVSEGSLLHDTLRIGHSGWGGWRARILNLFLAPQASRKGRVQKKVDEDAELERLVRWQTCVRANEAHPVLLLMTVNGFGDHAAGEVEEEEDVEDEEEEEEEEEEDDKEKMDDEVEDMKGKGGGGSSRRLGWKTTGLIFKWSLLGGSTASAENATEATNTTDGGGGGKENNGVGKDGNKTEEKEREEEEDDIRRASRRSSAIRAELARVEAERQEWEDGGVSATRPELRSPEPSSSLSVMLHFATSLKMTELYGFAEIYRLLVLLQMTIMSPHVIFALPKYAFVLDAIFHLVFLVVYHVAVEERSYHDASSGLQPAEIMLWVWGVALALREMEDFIENGKKYAGDGWNAFDIGVSLMVMAQIPLRLHIITLDNETNSSDSEEELEQGGAYYASTLLLGLTGVQLWTRLLFYLSTSASMGPMLYMVVAMGADIYKFIILFTVVLMAFATCFHVLASEDLPELYGTFGDSFVTLFAMLFGNYEMSDYDGLQYDFICKGLVILYVILSAILLLNLLIAIMGHSYSKIEEQSIAFHSLAWTRVVLSYRDACLASRLPIPLNLITFPVSLLPSMLKRSFRTTSRHRVRLLVLVPMAMLAECLVLLVTLPLGWVSFSLRWMGSWSHFSSGRRLALKLISPVLGVVSWTVVWVALMVLFALDSAWALGHRLSRVRKDCEVAQRLLFNGSAVGARCRVNDQMRGRLSDIRVQLDEEDDAREQAKSEGARMEKQLRHLATQFSELCKLLGKDVGVGEDAGGAGAPRGSRAASTASAMHPHFDMGTVVKDAAEAAAATTTAAATAAGNHSRTFFSGRRIRSGGD